MDTGSGDDVVVVVAREDDWERVRTVRLAALGDSPGAFLSTTERELAFDEERWRSWARSGRVVLATLDGRAVGMAAGLLEDGRTDVVSMWVEPSQRGGPTGTLLLQAVIEWARSTGAAEVGLAVMSDNVRATRFYARHGFATSSTRQSHKDPALDVHRMTLPLA